MQSNTGDREVHFNFIWAFNNFISTAYIQNQFILSISCINEGAFHLSFCAVMALTEDVTLGWVFQRHHSLQHDMCLKVSMENHIIPMLVYLGSNCVTTKLNLLHPQDQHCWNPAIYDWKCVWKIFPTVPDNVYSHSLTIHTCVTNIMSEISGISKVL